MASLTSSRSADMQTRVEDYLDDKFQTTSDLDNIDELLARVQQQQALLQKQLLDARQSLQEVEKQASQHTSSVQKQAEDFRNQQADIDRRLMIVAQSDVSDDAVKKFESRMGKVRRLEVATGYIETLKVVVNLSHDARKTLNTNPRAAISSYIKLRSLGKALKDAQPAAEGAAPHLVDQVEKEANSLYIYLKEAVGKGLQKTLEKMHWPKKEVRLPIDTLDQWSDQVDLLLDLQEPDLETTLRGLQTHPATEPIALLPLEVMVQPLAMRFQYHFYGDRPTNRLDKPEYFLSHILDLLDQHSTFISQILQPLLDTRVQKREVLENVYTDAVSAFITALLPMVSAKCLSLFAQASKQPQLLSHVVHELMLFDNTLRESWAYVPIPGVVTEWYGLTWTMLTTHGYFNSWLEAEQDFALERYKTIRDSADGGDIDYHSLRSGETKPTKGAIRVNDLLETITDRYKFLTSFSQKMKFLMEIQLAIFDDYHGHLHGALQAYLVTSHTAGRLIQGQSEVDATGLKGLETLTKIFGSAEYLDRKMSDWSEEVFFLELYDELQDRARRGSGSNPSIGRDLRVHEVAARTSSTIKYGLDDYEGDGGALFDETGLAYQQLRERSEAEICRTLETNLKNAIRPFTKLTIWAAISPVPSESMALSPSAALDSGLQTIASLFEFLEPILAPAPLGRITKQTCLMLQKEIYDNVLLRHSFSAAGAAQLKRDVSAIEDTVDTTTKLRGEAHRNLKRLNEALMLLNLPIKPSSAGADGSEDDEGWNFDPDTADDPATEAIAFDQGAEKRWGLWEVEKLIFRSNESARTALAAMGCEYLNEGDARNVLKRRIELNG